MYIQNRIKHSTKRRRELKHFFLLSNFDHIVLVKMNSRIVPMGQRNTKRERCAWVNLHRPSVCQTQLAFFLPRDPFWVWSWNLPASFVPFRCRRPSQPRTNDDLEPWRRGDPTWLLQLSSPRGLEGDQEGRRGEACPFEKPPRRLLLDDRSTVSHCTRDAPSRYLRDSPVWEVQERFLARAPLDSNGPATFGMTCRVYCNTEIMCLKTSSLFVRPE